VRQQSLVQDRIKKNLCGENALCSKEGIRRSS
jgi:hypothetical protein